MRAGNVSTPASTVPTRLALPIALGLYLFALALLLVRLDAHPSYPDTWEAYTAYGIFAFLDHPSLAIFRATEGLMTDSSASPLTIIPIWLAFRIGGVGLWSLRLATAIQAALAVPLLWWVGRRFVGAAAALVAALLLALSPVFLFYGRTATLVGLSLVPALVAIEALRRTLREPENLRWLVVLQIALCAGIYTYAPIRFLWPLALLALAFAYDRSDNARLALRRALVISLLVPWLVITVASLRDPITAGVIYFSGRGEQVFALSVQTDYYGAYLRPTPDGQPQQVRQRGPIELAARLIAQNSLDLGKLLLDRDTLPALVENNSARGRLYPAFLVPFFALGLLLTLREAFRSCGRRQVESALLLALATIWTVPLLFTSKVHIGRLIFFLPILCLLVAVGVVRPVLWIVRRGGVALKFAYWRQVAIGTTAALATLIVALVALSTWRDYRDAPPLLPDAAAISLLRASARSDLPRPSVALVFPTPEGEDPTKGIGEATRVGALRLFLDPYYRFVSLYPPDADPATPDSSDRTVLYSGQLLTRLNRPDETSLPCDAVYFVSPEVEEKFVEEYAARSARCGEPRYIVLP